MPAPLPVATLPAIPARIARRGWDLPATIELGVFSKAEGPWTVDWKRAHADARATLDSIDFAKRDLVLWAPGTDGAGVHTDFANAVEYLYEGGDVSLTYLRYEASWEMGSSLPTGLATLKLVLRGIQQRLAERGDAERHRVLLGGLSQGAWIIGEAAADPAVSSVIHRAFLVGHPWLAKTDYTAGHDPRIKVLNHHGDQITMAIKGSARVGMDAMTAVKTGKLGAEFGTVAKAILANPLHGVLLLQTQLRSVAWLRPYLRDPHVYGLEMPRMVRYLQTGVLDVTDEEIDDRKHGRRT